MMTTSPSKKTIELQADATVPRGASIKLTVEYRIRPPTSTESNHIYEGVSIEKNVDVNMDRNNQYNEQSKYKHEHETAIDRTHTIDYNLNKEEDDGTILVPDTIIEHISEDEKSTSSEEVVFEEWSEQFRCRRTDEYDPKTKELLRSTIDETSDRIKGDVIKEEYKEKNVRIKGHKSYDVVKQIHRRVPAKTLVPINQVQSHVHEEIRQSPPSSILKPTTTTSSSSLTQDHQWSSEEVYTTEVVQESNRTDNIDSSAAHIRNHVRPGRYSPVPSTTQAIVSTIPSADYHRVSEAVSPVLKYVDKPREDHVSEEYHIEVETSTKNHEDTNGQLSTTRRTSDWRNELKQMYSSTSSDSRYDQYRTPVNGNYVAQRISITPSNRQQRVKEVQIKISTQQKTPSEQRKFEPSPSARHTVKEVLVRISRSTSPEKHYHQSLFDDYEQKKKRNLSFVDYETPQKLSATTTVDNTRVQPPKRSASSSSILDERPAQTDRPTLSRVGVLRNTFESTTNGNSKDDSSKYLGTISPGLTEQRRKVFEEQEQANKEWTRRTISDYQSNERRPDEIHTGQSLVTDRISRFEHSDSKATSRAQSTERLGRTGFDTVRFSVETSPAKSTPQNSVDIKTNNRQVISSIDSDFGIPSQPIYQSTPKSIRHKYDDDAGHESEDELSEPKRSYDAQQRTSKSRLRDFSQSTSPSMDTSHIIERSTSRFNKTNMENMLSHVPTSRGKGVLIELSPDTYRSPTRSIYERNKSNVTPDSGVYDRTGTRYHLSGSPSSWRNNVSTSINDDGRHTNDNNIYIATTATRTNSPYTRRHISDADQTSVLNRYDADNVSGQPTNHQQRTVRRQTTHPSPRDYESPTNYRTGVDTQGKVPITTQSRTTKPLVVNEIETIETETQVECQIQRKNETNESTKTEQTTTSPVSSPKKLHTTTMTSHSSYNLSDEKTPAKRVVIQERPQYYEPINTHRSTGQDEVESARVSRANVQSYGTNPHPLQVTSLSSQTQITFDQHPPNEIVATVRIPELTNAKPSNSSTTIRQGTSDYESSGKTHVGDERFQHVHATAYRSPPVTQDYQQHVRARVGAIEPTNNSSSPINYSTRPSPPHQSSSREYKQRSYSPDPSLTLRSQGQYHSRSLGNLDFEIEIEKRPPHQSEQPTVITLDQNSRAIVTTSKDGRVSIQNIAARPGNTIVINSDFHASDRSLNRSSGYFSSDEIRSQGHNTNYSSDEQSSGVNLNSLSPSPRRARPATNEQTYHFDQVNGLVQQFAKPSTSSLGFNETIDQIDALYTNLDIQTNEQRPYDFSKSTLTTNRRKYLELNPSEYAQRFTSAGFQHIPHEQQITSTVNVNNNNNNNPNWTSTSSLNNLVMSTPMRPSQSYSSSGILADHATPGSASPTSNYGSIQNMIVHQNRLNGQSQVVQRNRASVKQVKQKNAARKRNGHTPDPYSDDDDDDNDSPVWNHSNLQQQPQRPPSATRSYNYNNH